MGKTLIVAEKPSVARDIARVLGCKSRGAGCIYGDKYIVTWAVGHLVTLASPEELDEKYKRWSLDTLPIIPAQMKRVVIPRVRKQYDIVSNWMNSDEIDDIVCATDSGREGELIFRYIYEMSGSRKPFYRLWISSLTDDAISEGFSRLRPGAEYDNLYASAKCRSEADWLVGMNASRGYTLTYKTLLSVGRVQSPTLAMIVKREEERQSFVPEQYFEMEATFGKYKGTWFDPAKKGQPHDTWIPEEKLDDLRALKEQIKGMPAEVTEVETEHKSFAPPLLYDLTELQRDGNRYYGWPAVKTLRIAQNLYEKRKAITYPRTDSRYLSMDLGKTLKSRLSKLKSPGWDMYVAMAMDSARNLGGRVLNDAGVTDHHAIIPTGRNTEMRGWEEDEIALFDLVVRRFIAIFLPNQEVENVRAVTVARGEHFRSQGKVVQQPGWSCVYDSLMARRRSKRYPELPPLQAGDAKKVTSAKILEKKTQPPAPYTEASLLSAMEHAGKNLEIEDESLKQEMKDSSLGTPATRAAIIERLIQVKYIVRRGKTLTPTEKGIKLIQVLPDRLTSAEMTGHWESDLARIGRGEAESETFIADIHAMVRNIVADVKTRRTNVVFPDAGSVDTGGKKRELGQCLLCGSPVLENRKAFYCSKWRSGCRMTIWKDGLTDAAGPELTADMMERLLKEQTLNAEGGEVMLFGERPFAAWVPNGGDPREAMAAAIARDEEKQSGRRTAKGAKKASAAAITAAEVAPPKRRRTVKKKTK